VGKHAVVCTYSTRFRKNVSNEAGMSIATAYDIARDTHDRFPTRRIHRNLTSHGPALQLTPSRPHVVGLATAQPQRRPRGMLSAIVPGLSRVSLRRPPEGLTPALSEPDGLSG
jgi:hypothetical protein